VTLRQNRETLFRSAPESRILQKNNPPGEKREGRERQEKEEDTPHPPPAEKGIVPVKGQTALGSQTHAKGERTKVTKKGESCTTGIAAFGKKRLTPVPMRKGRPG